MTAFFLRSGRRRWLLAIGAVLLLVALIGGLIGAGVVSRFSAKTEKPTVARTAPASPGDIDAITGVLRRHGDALIAHDRGAWLADLDTAAPAAGYREAQSALFDNIAAVPLQVWRYDVKSAVTTPDVIAGAAERLEARVVIVRVAVEYQLQDADPAPTSKDAWITATLRGTTWRLAGDSDVADQAGESWRGPWDFGPVSVHRSDHTLVLTHPATADRAAHFADLVERSIPAVDKVWGTNWNHRVVMLIPNDASEFDALAGQSGDAASIAAVTTSDQVTIDHVVLGARMVFNPQNLLALSPDGQRLVVQHELTHLAARSVTSDQMPNWLVEGFADYVGNLAVSQPVTTAAAELAAEIKAGQIPKTLPTAADFTATGKRLGAVYEEAWLACRLIAIRYGQSALVRFYEAVATQSDLDPDNALADAFRSVLHVDAAEFVARWRASLVSELTT